MHGNYTTGPSGSADIQASVDISDLQEGIITLLLPLSDLSLGKWGTKRKKQAQALSDLPSLPARGSAKDILPTSLVWVRK